MGKHSRESKDFLKDIEKMMKDTWEGTEDFSQASLYLWVLDYEDAYIYRYDISNVKFNFADMNCFDKFLEERGHDLQDCEFMLTDQSNFHIGN